MKNYVPMTPEGASAQDERKMRVIAPPVGKGLKSVASRFKKIKQGKKS